MVVLPVVIYKLVLYLPFTYGQRFERELEFVKLQAEEIKLKLSLVVAERDQKVLRPVKLRLNEEQSAVLSMTTGY